MGYDRDGIYRVNEDGFDKHGYYYTKNDNGEWINTGKMYNDRGFDYKHLFHKTRKNKKGFYRLSKDSGLYDEEGYDFYGLDKHRFNRNHFYVDENGNESFLNPLGVGYDGHLYEFNEKTQTYIKKEKYYDEEGYDFDGLNIDLFDRDHLYMHRQKWTPKYLFDWKHEYRGMQGVYLDEYEFDYKQDFRGIAGRKHDDHNFDRDGYWYKMNPESNQMEKTDQIINDENFDRDGFYYEFDEESRQYYKTEYKTNSHGIDINGVMHTESIRDKTFYSQFLANEKKSIEEYENILGNLIENIRELKEQVIEKNKKIPQHYRKQDDFKFINEALSECTNIKELMRRLEECTDIKEVIKIKKTILNKIASVKEYIKEIENVIIELDEKIKKQKKIEEELERKSQTRKSEFERFQAKFDENGICRETGLRYDQYYFNVDGINVVTNSGVNPRGFEFSGRCTTNNLLPYDKIGFKIDGTYYKTGERYHNGYNAYGVDENGKNRKGEIPIELKDAKEYTEIIFGSGGNPALIEFMKKYMKYNAKSTLDEAKALLKRNLYVAGEMYPPFKDEIIAQVTAIKGEITKLNQTIEDYKKQGAKQVRVIGFYEAKIKKLQEKLKLLSFDIGEK